MLMVGALVVVGVAGNKMLAIIDESPGGGTFDFEAIGTAGGGLDGPGITKGGMKGEFGPVEITIDRAFDGAAFDADSEMCGITFDTTAESTEAGGF